MSFAVLFFFCLEEENLSCTFFLLFVIKCSCRYQFIYTSFLFCLISHTITIGISIVPPPFLPPPPSLYLYLYLCCSLAISSCSISHTVLSLFLSFSAFVHSHLCGHTPPPPLLSLSLYLSSSSISFCLLLPRHG